MADSGTLRNFARQFGAAKINVLEKIGKRETNFESTEMQNEYKQVEETRVFLKQIYKSVNKVVKSSQAHVDDTKAVADALREYSNVLANDGNHPTLAAMFVKMGLFIKFYADATERLDFLLGLQSENIKDFVKGDIRDARMEKKKYDKIRQTYESSLESLKQAQKQKGKNVSQLEEESKKQEETYRAAGFLTLNSLRDVNKKNDFETLEKLCNMLDSYQDYFSKGLAWIQEMSPHLVKYKQHIEQSRQQFIKESQNREGAFDEHGKMKPQVFGAPLEELCKKDEKPVPIVVQSAIDYLNAKALQVEGIFRISGPKTEVDSIKRAYEEGQKVFLNRVENVHVVSGVLKLYLRELPAPLLTFELYDQFMLIPGVPEPEERAKKLKPLIDALPEVNRQTLKLLMLLCANIVQHVDKNKMTASNLATVLGPNLIRKQEESFLSMKNDMEMANAIIETMITYHKQLFDGPPSSKPLHATSLAKSQSSPVLTTSGTPPSTAPVSMRTSQPEIASSKPLPAKPGPAKTNSPTTPQDPNTFEPGCTVTALYPYKASGASFSTGDTDIDLQQNDSMTVLSDFGNGWLKVELGSKRGMVPSKYVKKSWVGAKAPLGQRTPQKSGTNLLGEGPS
eukprot:CAMPEP_0168569028 /NCGR_PEP_ID=MMETSP0413-20121227/15907_1 /TAXON_ID=136452 /ORGANISM="Filamoeba nolandi, Strain NC-AS-23-1" /LENGTH=622 /DNA_ID=CAMNT_0008601433 /DNA_START=86 /DNA_END=1954 /DNA_ORIENTATION=+